MSPRERRRRRRTGAREAAKRGQGGRRRGLPRHPARAPPSTTFDPTLDRVRAVCELLGDPQHAYRVVHVTGTNGKTSTARMVERLVREHGLRTGRFTSPHLTSVSERIAIDGEPISAERFVEVWQDVAPYVHMVDQRSAAEGGPRLSFFEVLTVMAFAAFADAPVDVAIIEVGMGGPWDSTNVVDGEVAVITPISLDHERWLGHELTHIAGEKAGIIKDGATRRRWPTQRRGRRGRRAGRRGRARRPRRPRGRRHRGRRAAGRRRRPAARRCATLGGVYTEVFLPLHGEHQAHNALLALAAAEALLSGGARARRRASSRPRSPTSTPRAASRSCGTSPTILVDAAHNPAGRRGARGRRSRRRSSSRGSSASSGCWRTRTPRGSCPVLEPLLAEIVVTRSSSARALDAEDLAEVADRRLRRGPRARGRPARRRRSTSRWGSRRPPRTCGSGVLVTGSVTIVADARVLLGRG